jgi:DNA-directed RNA polymerase subunit H (RpoH/RPB5)
VRADCANKRGIYKLGFGLFAKVGCCVKITRRAGCANKRRIYKLGFGLFAKVGCCVKITRRAGCANKRGIYKLVWIICESGLLGRNYGARRLRK